MLQNSTVDLQFPINYLTCYPEFAFDVQRQHRCHPFWPGDFVTQMDYIRHATVLNVFSSVNRLGFCYV